MAYLGNDLQVAYSSYKNIDDISASFNGSTTSFPLLVSGAAPVPPPLNSQQCLISVGGVIQRPDDTGSEGFRLSGGNIVFSSAPSTGEDFFGIILAGADYVNVGANFPSGSATVPSITFDQDTDTGFYRPSSGSVALTSNGSTVVTVDNTGKLGIGTASPAAALDVVGAIKTSSTFTASGDVTVPSINGGPIAGTRNRIINGAMAVDQRLSGVTTFTAGAALAYNADRWYGYCTGANVTGQRVTGATAGQFRYQFSGAASVTAIGFGQRIELFNSADLAGTTATLSVDLANSVLTTVTWTAFYANTNDTFGTLASPTRTQIATGTFTVNSTVTRYSTNISIPAAATTGIEIVFTVGAQISGTWTIGDVQLERGTIATPFERRSYGQELALCQRYYYKDADNGVNIFQCKTDNATAYNSTIRFPVTMRTAPTCTATSGGESLFTSSRTVQNQSVDAVRISAITGASAGTGYYFTGITASAEL